MVSRQEKPEKEQSKLSQLEFELFNQEETGKHEEWGKYQFFSAKMVRDLMQEEEISIEERNKGRKPKELSESDKRGTQSEDKENNLYPFLRKFYVENKEIIHEIYGTSGAYQTLKKELLKQLKQVKDLMYLKRIEDTLSKTVETRIGDMTQNVREEMASTYGWSFSSISDIPEENIEDYFSEKFREKVVGLIGHETDIDGNAIRELRNARGIADFEGLHIKIDEEYVKGYRELVQHELREQIAGIASAESQLNEEEKIRSIHGKANFLIDFVVSHVDDLHGAKEFTKAHLLNQIQSDEGAELISTLYERVLESLEAEDASESERIVTEMSTQLKVMSLLEREKMTQSSFEKYAPELAITQKEMGLIFTPHYLKSGERSYFTNAEGVSYQELIGRGLQNIEMAKYQIALNRMLPVEMHNQTMIDRYLDQINGEMSALKKQIQHFREEIYNTDQAVEDQSDWMSFQKRSELKQALKALKFVYGIKKNEKDTDIDEALDGKEVEKDEGPMKPILIRLAAASSDEDINGILELAEQDVIAYLGERAVDEDQIKKFKKIDPYFNLFSFFHKWKKENPQSPLGKKKEEKEEKIDNENSPIIVNPVVLDDIRTHLEQMQEIVDREFSEDHDKDAFDDSRRYLQKTLKVQQFKIDEPVYDDKGKPLYMGTQRVTEVSWAQQDLPILEKQQLESLMNAREHQERYAHVEELRKAKFFKLDADFNNPNNVREGMEALFGGFHEVNKGHTQLKMLSKVMSMDHPLTAIRFHSTNKVPMMNNGGYQIHRVPGEPNPATYLDRSRHLLRVAQEYILQGNYVQLEKLFERGQIGDRLFIDASFFPLMTLKSPDATLKTFYKEERKDTQIAWVIDDDRISSAKDRNFFDKKYMSLEGKDGTFKREREFEELQNISNSLIDEGAFQMSFGANNENMQIEAIANYQEAIVYNEDGTVNEEASLDAFDGLQDYVMGIESDKECRGLGIPGGTKISEEKLREIAKDYPVMAGRMAQFNSMVLGGTVGGAEMAAQMGLNVGRFARDLPGEVLNDFWKKMDWYSPQHIWMATDQMIEHITGLADFRVKIGSYELLMNVFAGTLVGNEFTKLYQGEEDKRVNEFKDAFGDFGHDQVIEKIYTASDQFELKAALLEGMENRGVITLEDLLDRRFFKQLNLYTKGMTIPMNVSEADMESDEEVRFKMIEHLRSAMDDIWGDGTWQSWRSASASKYESKRKESWDNFSGNSGREKARYYEHYWELLKTDSGIAELKKMHPGELVGNIEQDLEQGDNDSGTNFAIMQAMISMGIVKLDHVRRLQTAHTNDLPIHALLEPKQAEICGLSDHIKKALAGGHSLDYDNPVVLFYQGQSTLPLKGIRASGKWKFLVTDKQKKAAEEDKSLEDIEVTVHQLQAYREAQPEFHRKMDNSCIGIFSPCYEWAQIENALSPNTQGNIEARPHDIVAAYRGIHYEFGAYMEAMGDKSKMKDALTFKRTVWNAYKSICKTQAYASFMTRQKGRTKDYNMNTLDGSPNFESKHKEERASSGTTNFEKLILEGATGPHQRMGQSSEHLDGIDSMSSELRRDFKYMAGFHMVKSLGVNPETGKADRSSYTPYNKETFDPAGQWKKVMGSFMNHVKSLASQHSWGAEVIGSLNSSGMGDTSMENSKRIKKLNGWVVDEAKM